MYAYELTLWFGEPPRVHEPMDTIEQWITRNPHYKPTDLAAIAHLVAPTNPPDAYRRYTRNTCP